MRVWRARTHYGDTFNHFIRELDAMARATATSVESAVFTSNVPRKELFQYEAKKPHYALLIRSSQLIRLLPIF
jgi:hypothetical protein